MKFKEVSFSFLKRIHGDDTYAGGTNDTRARALKVYVSNKQVTQRAIGLKLREVRADVAFKWCYFCTTDNAEAAENQLLKTDSSWNHQAESGLEPKAGFVYVLAPEAKHSPSLEEQLGDLLH